MGVDRTRHAMAAAAAVALLAVAGCTQSAPTENSATDSAAETAAPAAFMHRSGNGERLLGP